METVTIGCRLPQGLVLEVGYTTTIKVGNGTVPQLNRGENYARFELLGTNAQFRKTRIRMPASMSPEPYINRNVPKVVWDEWERTHRGSWLLKSGNLFVVAHADEAASVDAQVIDSVAKPLILSPLDPSKKVKVPGAGDIETAKFDSE